MMQRQIFILSTLCICLLTFCKKENASIAPTCIQTKVDEFKANVEACATSNITEYTFQGKQVFVFDNSGCCCDQAGEVFDNQCISLGLLGGIIGNTKINGVEFASNATVVKVIWKP
jgi:hypothetical protein